MEANKSACRSSTNGHWQRGSYRSQNERRKRRRRKPWSEKICDWSRALIAFLFSNVGIVCLVVGYTIVGAFLFTYIEARDSLDISGDVVRLRNVTAATLWKLTSKENIFSEGLWKRKVRAILESYQKRMVKAIRDGYDGVEEHKKWTFAGAFLYSLTVITTIGYGNICPRTEWGKLCTIVYAIIGMPLFLLYLSNIGDIFARSFKWTYARCCLCKCHKTPRDPISLEMSQVHVYMDKQRKERRLPRLYEGETETWNISQDGSLTEINNIEKGGNINNNYDDHNSSSTEYDPQQVTVPLTLCLAIMVGYVIAGALLFSKWEDWNMLDGSYFCFVSLSTIGFGDIVPGDRIYSGQGFELSFIFCSMYLMLGMALIAMCFNLMQEEVIAKVQGLVRIIKYIFRCDR
ncbi:hypothetical protein KPH14_002745 [Odynerus spinipes]|uniref:Potassium channel domain-containing protein n=1 Tax=Odynerus spinipes TaxID=1348599 RepID=A0AAD9RM64_9HYME|nr:hypothetical protein KPH14_002745 [Odynerus spinipes]